MSESSRENSAAKSKSPRSPVERGIVWGLIGVLVVITGIEGRARLGYSQSFERVHTALLDGEAGRAESLTIDQVTTLITGSPVVSHEKQGLNHIARYEWKGLFKTYSFDLPHGSYSKVVTNIVTRDAPPETSPAPVTGGSAGAAPSAAEDESPSETGSDEGRNERGAGEGRGAGGGERPRFDPLQADADGDGKLSREEVTGRMAEAFDSIDTNQDGFLDAAELAARPRPSRSGRGAGRAGDGREGDSPAAEATPPEGAPSESGTPADTSSTNSGQ